MSPNSGRQLRILIVEDMPIYSRFLCELIALSGLNASVIEAPRLDVAEELLKVNPFDVILLDNTLPNGKGRDAIMRMLRPHAPVLIVTASEDDETWEMALTNGAEEFIEKSKLNGVNGPKIINRLIRSAMYRHQGHTNRVAAYARALAESQETTIKAIRPPIQSPVLT